MFKSELNLLNKYLNEEYVGFNDKKDIIASMDFSNIQDFFPEVIEIPWTTEVLSRDVLLE